MFLLIWKKQGECDNEFEELKKILNTISNINMECGELSESFTFLGLDVSMNRESKKFYHNMIVKK